MEAVMDWHSTVACEQIYIELLAAYQPDVIVSVHPNLNLVPMSATRKYGLQEKKHIPFFTVVTDLGSGHCGWFQKDVDRLYLASEKIRALALRRGRTPIDRIQLTGLPIRHEFAVIAEQMGDRLSVQGKLYRTGVKQELNINPNKPMILVMGGGEGVGSLAQIVTELYASLVKEAIDATICVVCAKNLKLKESFEQTDWDKVLEHRELPSAFQRLKSHATTNNETNTETEESSPPKRGTVTVIPLGFVTRMAEYMAAAELLITKAGPGTIAEAASLGLPVMLTSFLPGQEAGNVDVVLEYGFGGYSDKPVEIAETVATWMKLPNFLDWMSRKATEAGHPDAAEEIVLDIGSRTHAWLEWNASEQRKDDTPTTALEF
jgi:1,2-diacylglycerol 3-beta-galactosyltransferase